MRAVEALGPDVYDRSMMGVVVDTSTGYGVNVQGNVIPARWNDPTVIAAGDNVLVQLIIGRTGQTEAFVKGRITTKPRPGRGTVSSVPPSSDTIVVIGEDGGTYTAYFMNSYTPVVSDVVVLQWFGANPTVMGKVAATPAPPVYAPPPPVAPPPPPPQTGQTSYAATDSNTFWGPGGWGSWAGGGGRVFQGSYGAGQVYGAWFYAGSPGQLKGRTITRFRIILGSRQAVGSYNSPVTVHFYAHSNTNRPGGDVTRTIGPHDVTAWPGQGPTMYDLPGSFATQVINGGGIGIALDPYAGFQGRAAQPDSGKLIFDWRM